MQVHAKNTNVINTHELSFIFFKLFSLYLRRISKCSACIVLSVSSPSVCVFSAHPVVGFPSHHEQDSSVL